LNPAGGFGARGFSGFASDPLFVPQPFVAVVQDHGMQQPLGGSFFCQVHNRGFATQGLFFDHLLAADGVNAGEASEMLVEGGGVWIFPAN
jgi:hypothetical protein